MFSDCVCRICSVQPYGENRFPDGLFASVVSTSQLNFQQNLKGGNHSVPTIVWILIVLLVGAGGGFAALTCVERRGPLCPIASGDRLLCRNALRQRHGFGDARPLRGAVFLRIRATDRVRCAAKFHFADAAVSLRVQIASGGQGASPLEPDRRGAGAGGGFAALTRLTDNVLCLYSRSEYGTLRKKNFRTESIARYSFSSPSSAKPCG